MLTTIAAIVLSQESTALRISSDGDFVDNDSVPAGIRFSQYIPGTNKKWLGLTESGQVIGCFSPGVSNGRFLINQVPSHLAVTEITGSINAGAAMLEDGRVFWWTNIDPSNELSSPSTGTTTETYKSISMGSEFVIGVTSNGEVRYLGFEELISQLPDPPQGENFRVVRFDGQDRIYGLTEDGTVLCWGDYPPQWAQNPITTDWVNFHTAGNGTLAGIREDGSVYTYGDSVLTLGGSFSDIAGHTRRARLIGLRDDGSIVENTQSGGQVIEGAGRIKYISPACNYESSGQVDAWGCVAGEGFKAEPIPTNPSSINQRLSEELGPNTHLLLESGEYEIEESMFPSRCKHLIGSSKENCLIRLSSSDESRTISIENCSILIDKEFVYNSAIYFKNCDVTMASDESRFRRDYTSSDSSSLIYAVDCKFSGNTRHLVETNGSCVFEDCEFSNPLIFTGSGSVKLVRCTIESNQSIGLDSMVVTKKRSDNYSREAIYIDLFESEIDGMDAYRGTVLRSEDMTVKIKNASIKNCTSLLGTIWCDNTNLFIDGCQFDSNTSDIGADIYAQSGSWVSIRNSVFTSSYGTSSLSLPFSFAEITSSFFGYHEELWNPYAGLIFASDSYFCENLDGNEAFGSEFVDLGGNSISSDCSDFDCNQNGVIDDEEVSTGEALDCNQNGIPDSCDLDAAFENDCNSNQIPDSCEIADGLLDDCDTDGVPDVCTILDSPSQDSNNDGILDRCQCITDINGDGFTDFSDVLQVLSCWGDDLTDNCLSNDVTEDGRISFSDLIIMLSNFGPC